MLVKRIISRVLRAGKNVAYLSKGLLSSLALPDTKEALVELDQLSPDLGGSCLTNEHLSEKERIIPLSVIVPAYNVEKNIKACMDSILFQKAGFEYEVIVIDDGSTDATLSILHTQYGHHPKVRIIYQKNEGSSAARNAGIRLAKGEYLTFVDSDDMLAPASLGKMMDVAIKEKAMLVVGSIENRRFDGSVRKMATLADGKAGNASLPGFAWGKVYHYSVFSHIQFPNGYWFQDSILAQIIHPMCKGSIYTISDVCYYYCANDAGITAVSRGNPKSLDSLWITMRLLEERAKFGLDYTQESYEYFLSMTVLTYHRTKALGTKISKSIFVQQHELMERYYSGFHSIKSKKNQLIEDALFTMNFKKFIIACEL